MANDIGGPIGGRADGPSSFFNGVPRTVYTGNVPVKASTDGTDTTPVITETYIAEIEIPVGCRATGFANFNGSVASGNLKVILFNSAGTVIASSASTAMSGTDAFQRIPFSAPINLRPGQYFVGLQVNNTTARVNTHPIGNFAQFKKTGEVYGTATAITPVSTFTAGVGPMGGLY